MRLIRSGFQPFNFSGQFGRQRLIKTSNACVNPAVSTDRSNVGPGSNIQWRGRSYTASVPSDTPEVKKDRRRVSKDERKSMVENYVNKYRTMNAGKFPTVSDAKKDVGGSYYVVRQILQELKYNSKMSSLDTMDATSVEKGTVKDKSIDLEELYQTRESGQIINHSKPSVDVLVSSSESRLEVDICEDGQTSIDTTLATKETKENKILTAGGDLLSSQTKEDLVDYHDVQINRVSSNNIVDKEKSLTEAEEVLSNPVIVDKPISKQLIEDSIFTNFDSKEWPKSLNSVESDESKDDGTQVHHPFLESRGSLDSHLENSENNSIRESTSEDLLKIDELKPTDVKQQSIESEKPGRKLHKMHAEDVEPERKSVWQNLKSFANGIFGMWRRS